MKTPVLIIIILLLSSITYSQNNKTIPVINAQVGEELSDAIYSKWKKIEDINQKRYEEYEKTGTPPELSDEDKNTITNILKITTDDIDSYLEEPYPWSVYEWGCSWYCGASYETKASSHLANTERNTYDVSSISDDDTRTAWVEGVPGYGIGEYIDFIFPINAARATNVYIVNGYAKNEKTWKNNSRVKSFNLYYNNELIAIVNLKDKMSWQSFELPYPIPLRDERVSIDADYSTTVTLRFMITDVYHGDKYDDTAISALIFSGIDVHCLAEGTKIATMNGSINIEDLIMGDNIKVFDPISNTITDAQIKQIHKAKHKEIIKLKFNNGTEIIATSDHPFLTKGGWASLMPLKTKQYKNYRDKEVYQYTKGTFFYFENKEEVELLSIELIETTSTSYSLELENPNVCYIAGGLLVGQE